MTQETPTSHRPPRLGRDLVKNEAPAPSRAGGHGWPGLAPPRAGGHGWPAALIPAFGAASPSLLAALILVFCAPSTSALAATISGRVVRPPAPAPHNVEVDRYRSGSSTKETSDAATETSSVPCACNPGEFSVVWLTGENLPRPAPSSNPPRMAQRDRMFVPAVIAIPVGGTVAFPNDDPFFHNVFSYSKTRTFDLGRYPKGDSHDVRFEKPGIVPVFCEIHYSMRAYIHVLESPYFAVSDERGRFSISDVAPGNYTIHVWQENLAELTRPLVVTSDDISIEIP